jgi:hypothetical protein
MMDLPHEQATSDPDRTLELRDNLADFLKIVFAEADAGILETVPAEKVAAELGLNWQSVAYEVCLISLAHQILARP